MDAQCSDAGGIPFKSASPVAGSSEKQIEILLAAGQNGRFYYFMKLKIISKSSLKKREKGL
jgi:hypothetical protein